MPPQVIDLPFPMKGIDDGWGFGRQPTGTTPDAENVVPFDPIGTRARGGQRWGISKYFPSQHNGSAALQKMLSVATASSRTATYTVTEPFTNADAPFWSAYPLTWNHYVGDWQFNTTSGATAFGAVINADAQSPAIVSNEIKCDEPATSLSSSHLLTRSFTLTGNYSITFDFKCDGNHGSFATAFFMVLFRANPVTNEYYALRFAVEMWPTQAGMTTKLIKGNGTAGSEILVNYSGAGGYTSAKRDALMAGITITVSITAAGVITVDFGDFPIDDLVTDPMDSYSGNHEVGFGVFQADSSETFPQEIYYVDNFVLAGIDASETGRIFELIAVSGGDVYTGKLNESLAAATNGTNVLDTTGRVDAEVAFGNVYLCDGDATNYRLLTMATTTVSAWTASITAGVLPCDAVVGATTYAVASADSAAKQFTYTGDLTSVVSVNDHIKISGSTSNDGAYSVSAISYSNPTTTITVRQSPADDTADGNIQLASLGCDIIALYRGRIAMAGLLTDPHNWFMTASGNPLDLDYGAVSSATMAVAGNSSDLGKCADNITCLAPYSDDLMYMGGDHTIWLMRGDPAAGGAIDNVSYQTGIAGPDAYTFDPNGVFYFFGAGTVWRIVPNGVPEPFSRSRMDQTFGDINLAANTVHLEWDNARHGLLILVKPKVSGSTTQYYWDERTDSFWKLSFPNDHGPSAPFAFDGDNPNDNAMLFGGWDGYIRKIDSSADDDDGTAIDSYILYAPLTLGGALQNTKITRVIGVLDATSDDVLLTAYAEDTPQGAVESSSIRYARTLSAGRTTVINRVTGNSVLFKLSNLTNDETWAIESLTVLAEPVGHTRKYQL